MNCIRKLIMTICVGMIILCSASATCLAETVSWKLRYVRGGPASLQIEEWSTTVNTTMSNTTMSATNITDGAEIYVHTSNGIDSIYKTTTATSVKTEKGIKIYAYVDFSKKGNRTNYPAGRLVY